MSFTELKKRIESSDDFKEFKKKNPKSLLYSAFFTIRDAHGNLIIDSQQLDYVLSEKSGKKIMTFFIEDNQIRSREDELKLNPGKVIELKNPECDIKDILEIIKKEINEKKLTPFKISKIIVILQNIEDKQIWNIICIFDLLKMLRIHLDLNGKIIESKTQSISDIVNFDKGKKK